MLIKYLTASLVGAIIGYITNWLAIKMLFRPHEEKKVLGIKIPFTPGLIPKERYRIAKSVGETIGTHLLSKETIVEALNSNKMRNHTKAWIASKIQDLSHCEDTVEHKLKTVFKDNYEGTLLQIKTDMARYFYETIISSEGFKQKIGQIISENFKKLVKHKPISLIEVVGESKIKEGLMDVINTYKSSEELKEWFNNKAYKRLDELKSDERLLKDVLPQELITAAKSYIFNNRKEISKLLEDSLSEPEIEHKLKMAIGEGVSANVNPLMAMFLNSETIYGKVKSFITKYLQEEENQIFLSNSLIGLLNKLINNKVSEALENVHPYIKEGTIEEVLTYISDKIATEELIDKVVEVVLDKAKEVNSLEEILLNIDQSYEEKVNALLSNKLQEFIEGEQIHIYIKDFIDMGVYHIMNTEIATMVSGNEETMINILDNSAESLINKFIEKEAMNVIELLNIPKIVEEQINSFDVMFAEKIILEIASKELSAITWLGALLGAIIGILSPILNSI
ncbi:DUF445 family protein [Desnuesiella massiliensis]|uniref:DUF445 family protein n=1 Tax=Desnuesiella massiliensis TaxID=1650662 RepID=UPI0006E447EF|nr:DUF445 family protein [Desnuesiella massiliensis]